MNTTEQFDANVDIQDEKCWITEFNRTLCEALGINAAIATKVVVTIAGGQVPTVRVEYIKSTFDDFRLLNAKLEPGHYMIVPKNQ